MLKLEVLKLVQPFSNKAEQIVEALEKAGALNLSYGNEGIAQVIDAFKQHYGVTKTSKYDRWAANRLVKKHGVETVVAVIQVMAAAQQQPYCPVINSISQLEDKWLSISNFIQKNAVKQEMRI